MVPSNSHRETPLRKTKLTVFPSANDIKFYFSFKQADVLVCSVGSNLNLSIGTLARAMSKAAGPDLQDALLKETSIMKPGGVVHTSSVGKLPCRHVMFCVCCPWDKGLSDEKEVGLLSNDPGKKGSNFFCCGAIRFSHIELFSFLRRECINLQKGS